MPAKIIVGSQWGDEGKGLISAYTSVKDDAFLVCKAGTGCNAEHGIFLENEETYLKVNQLPLGWILNKNSQIRIGSGVALNPWLLLSELDRYRLDSERVRVDFRCPIITPDHVSSERASKSMATIGSTFSGTGFCQSDFVLRKAEQARDIPEMQPYLIDLAKEINFVAKDKTVVIESSQGTFLSLAVSSDYPNVTSGNVTTCAVADDVLLNWKYIQDVILVVKALPTREGAGSMGYSNEYTEEEIIQKGLFEASSIGGVARRKTDGIDFELLKYAVEINGATEIALTFCEHYDPEVKNVRSVDEITPKIWKLIEHIEDSTGVVVNLLNTGKGYCNIVDLDMGKDQITLDKIENGRYNI